MKGKTRGLFLRRDNRFTCTVDVGGRPVKAHLANSGRLKELLVPGAEVLMVPNKGKLPYKLIGARKGNIWVSLDSHLVNRFFIEIQQKGLLPFATGWRLTKKEVSIGKRRLDFLFEVGGTPLLVEVKSCTLVRRGIALFPDAPTERGADHLIILRDFVRKGNRASIIFVAQREDALSFAPNSGTHIRFARDLYGALHEGVRGYLIVSRFDITSAELILLRWKEFLLPEALLMDFLASRGIGAPSVRLLSSDKESVFFSLSENLKQPVTEEVQGFAEERGIDVMFESQGDRLYKLKVVSEKRRS